MPASIEHLPSLVGVGTDPASAQSTTHSTVKQIPAPPPARNMTTVGSIELLSRNQGRMIAREPLVPKSHLSQVHTIVHDLPHRRVTDPNLPLDSGVARPARPQGKDPPDKRSYLVRH